jgi:dTDP-4-dehydrorhamnose reductase
LLNALKVIIKEGYLIGLYHLVSNEKISKYNLLKNMNIVFNKNITLVEDGKYKVDKSLINTRIDCSFHVKEYDKMINEMNSWIKNHKVLYSHYYMNLE